MPEKEKQKNKTFDMNSVKIVHFVGIGGCGMSAIAKILLKKGFKISGSDLRESANTMRLKDLGARIYIGHNGSNVRGADLTVVSSAIPEGNVEVDESRSSGIPTEKRAVMLSWIMDQFINRVAVAGTHGKTTTTSMIATALYGSGMDPTFLIGGETNDVDGNARLGKGSVVVAEADESDGSFLTLHPNYAVITNIESDHMDYYGTYDKVVSTFFDFASLVPDDGFIAIGNNNKVADLLLKEFKNKNIVKYGLSEKSDYYADSFRFRERTTMYTAYRNNKKLGEITLSIPGKQNIENSLAAIAVCTQLGCDFSNISNSLHSFIGVKRRFQVLGDLDGVLVIDDYGHHPTEVAKTLESARLGYPQRRIICVFQPHRFTRTLHLYEEFGKSFSNADVVIITDVYSAGEKPIEGISGKTVYDEVKKNAKEAVYIKKKEQIADHLMNIVRPGDIIITMGAGDITNTGKEILKRLKSVKGLA